MAGTIGAPARSDIPGMMQEVEFPMPDQPKRAAIGGDRSPTG